LMERRKLFQMRDRISAEIVPKGVLVMGISGCGKSLSIKAIASCFELPLYRIDMIAILSGRHGTAEGAFAQACHMLESMAPAVVWFDEIEAGINTQAKEGELSRIFGFFLTWMQEKTRGLFVGATANRIDLLPAEMIRKGRFDEVFFVDLPLEEERLDIFRLHLRRRGIGLSVLDFAPLQAFAAGWTGAEIERGGVSGPDAMTAGRPRSAPAPRRGSGSRRRGRSRPRVLRLRSACATSRRARPWRLRPDAQGVPRRSGTRRGRDGSRRSRSPPPSK